MGQVVDHFIVACVKRSWEYYKGTSIWLIPTILLCIIYMYWWKMRAHTLCYTVTITSTVVIVRSSGCVRAINYHPISNIPPERRRKRTFWGYLRELEPALYLFDCVQLLTEYVKLIEECDKLIKDWDNSASEALYRRDTDPIPEVGSSVQVYTSWRVLVTRFGISQRFIGFDWRT